MGRRVKISPVESHSDEGCGLEKDRISVRYATTQSIATIREQVDLIDAVESAT